MNFIKNWLKSKALKKQEQQWELYNETPKLDIEMRFAFIDQLRIGGHYHAPITWDTNKTVNNAIMIINLNQRVTEKSIVSAISHESIHIAITNCLKNSSDSGMIEKVIAEWIMKEELFCDTWQGSIKVRKIEENGN